MSGQAREVILTALHHYGLFAANVVNLERNKPEAQAADMREFIRKCRELGPLCEGVSEAIQKGDLRLVGNLEK